MSNDGFFIITSEVDDAARRIAGARDVLATRVTAFHSGAAAQARTNDALPSADLKGDYGTDLDQLDDILDKLTTVLGTWATSFTTTADLYRKSDAVAAGTIANSMPVTGTLGGEPVTFTPESADRPAPGATGATS